MANATKPRNLHQVGPGGIVLQIDVGDADTPALVWDSLKHKVSSTFDCALASGWIDDTIELDSMQLDWLAKFEPRVDEAFDYVRGDQS